LSGCPEDDALTRREAITKQYQVDFLTACETDNSDVGSVRLEARKLFLIRWNAALDKAISKHDTMVLTADTAFGKKSATGGHQDPGNCVACDRPLRRHVRPTSASALTQQLQNQQKMLLEMRLKEVGEAEDRHSTGVGEELRLSDITTTGLRVHMVAGSVGLLGQKVRHKICMGELI